MKIEYQITPELSLLVREDGMVEYSLHNRIYPQAYTSSILTRKEFLEATRKHIHIAYVLELNEKDKAELRQAKRIVGSLLEEDIDDQ